MVSFCFRTKANNNVLSKKAEGGTAEVSEAVDIALVVILNQKLNYVWGKPICSIE